MRGVNILDNVLSLGSNGSDDKIKESINSIIGSNQVPSFVGDILNKALEKLNQGKGAGLVSPMINKALESYSKYNSLMPDMNELFKLTSNNRISDVAGNIINTLIKKIRSQILWLLLYIISITYASKSLHLKTNQLLLYTHNNAYL